MGPVWASVASMWRTRSSSLAALYGAVVVLVDGAGAHDAHLGAAVLLQAVEVVAGHLVVQQRAVGHAGREELAGLGVDVVGVHVVVGREGRLGTVDGEEARGVGLHVGAGLAAVEHVVGERGERGGPVGRGPPAGDGLGAHGMLLPVWRGVRAGGGRVGGNRSILGRPALAGAADGRRCAAGSREGRAYGRSRAENPRERAAGTLRFSER